MRFLRDDVFPWAGDGKLVITTADESPPTIAQVVLRLADMHSPSEKAPLTIGEMRKLASACAVLEVGPDADGLLAFEEDAFAVLRKVVLAMAERILVSGFWRNVLVLDTLFEKAAKDRPKLLEFPTEKAE